MSSMSRNLKGVLEDIAHILADCPWWRGGTTMQEIKEVMPDVLVYPAMRWQRYGGPEEGGWWYDTWTPQRGRDDGAQEMPLYEAIRYCRRANALAKALINSKQPGYTDTNSNGMVEWVWTWEKVPTYEPQERPRYE